ncbi:MAG: inositol monophosphatase family protein, partial [Kistimonas sp.]|nr:inositol monophosphatase family protein [Kistimonas sp.]
MQPMVNIALRAARKGSDILTQGYEQQNLARLKGKEASDYATEVARAAGKAVVTLLQKTYPEHGFLCRQTGHQPGRNEGEDYLWMVDPLAGRINFIHGVPLFALAIACQYRNRIEHALVLHPGSGEEFTASRNRGATLSLGGASGGSRLRVSNRSTMAGSVVATTCDGQGKGPLALPGLLSRLTEETDGIRCSGCPTLDMAWVAAGRYDGFCGTGLTSWNLAACTLLIKEAGGLVGDFRGGDKQMDSGQAVCGTPKVFRDILVSLQ